MSGKSVAWRTLMNAKTQMCKDGVDGYHPVRCFFFIHLCRCRFGWLTIVYLSFVCASVLMMLTLFFVAGSVLLRLYRCLFNPVLFLLEYLCTDRTNFRLAELHLPRRQVHPFVINPKSVTLSELYGAYDLSTFEWADGILSTLFKQSAESDKPDEKVR